MNLIVYHGSDSVIDKPRFDGGRRFSDFGLGFYCTTNIEMAKSWSTRKDHTKSYVNKYIFDANGITSLTFDLDIEWILFIAYNRGLILNDALQQKLESKYKNLDSYDIILGPTADDRMFDTLSMFFENIITIKHCLEALNSMDLDIQYNLRTEKAINALKYKSSFELDKEDKEYYRNETFQKKKIMNNKMNYIRRKFGNEGKFFDELEGSDIDG